MAVLGVLLILLLGYRINSKVDEKNYKLKRSTGWVSYVMLGADGAISVGIAILLLMLIYVFLLLIGSLLSWDILNLSLFEPHITTLLINDYVKIIFILMLLTASLIVNEIRLNLLDATPDLSALKKLDGMMSIIITALENSSYLKISLSSGKVYVGVLIKEDFKSGPDETLIILPMLSGYRTKENLRMHLDCNYLEVYLKHGIVERAPDGICYNPERADTASMLIPVSEIESVSFFDINIHQDFNIGSDTIDKFRDLQKPKLGSPIQFDIMNYLDKNK